MPNIKKFEDAGVWVEIDLDLCSGAGACVDVCPTGVYEVRDGKVRAEHIGECAECGSCKGECPNGALLGHSAWE